MKAIEQEYKLLDRYNDVLTFKEVKEVLRLSDNKTYQLLRDKTLPSFKLGSHYRILKISIIDYFNQISR